MTEESGREAEWLAGWVALHHLNKKKESIIHFTKVFENTKDENMKAKAAYWIAMSNNLLNENTHEKKMA